MDPAREGAVPVTSSRVSSGARLAHIRPSGEWMVGITTNHDSSIVRPNLHEKRCDALTTRGTPAQLTSMWEPPGSLRKGPDGCHPNHISDRARRFCCLFVSELQRSWQVAKGVDDHDHDHSHTARHDHVREDGRNGEMGLMAAFQWRQGPHSLYAFRTAKCAMADGEPNENGPVAYDRPVSFLLCYPVPKYLLSDEYRC
jgi:hypothetical protein